MTDLLIAASPALIPLFIGLGAIGYLLHVSEKKPAPEHLNEETRHWLENGQG